MEIGIGIGIVLLIGYLIHLYNKIIETKENTINAEKQISVQLDRRGKVFDSLINSVKKAMDYENSTLKDIIALRTKAVKIDGDAISNIEKQKLENELSSKIASGELTNALNITVEAYPELKANNNLMQLQEEIVSTENKLSYAKQAYNDAIETYNAMIQSVPEVFIVSSVPSLKKNFKYWELSEEKVHKEEERIVEFG